jgi:membrane protease YdiL (CAAX protease family)
MEQGNPNRLGITDRAGLFILVMLMAAGLVLGGGLSIVAWKIMTGQSMLQMQASLMNPTYVNELRVIQTVSALCMFFIPAFVTTWRLSPKPLSYMGFNTQSSFKSILLGMMIMGITIVLAGALATLNEMIPLTESLKASAKAMEETYMKQVVVLSNMNGVADLMITLVVMALAPAIFEEVFFRAGFQNMMNRATGKTTLSIVITSLVFSAIHFSYYGFFARFALGMTLGYLFAYSKNIWIPILAHFLNNGIGVIQIYLLHIKGKKIEENMDDKFPLWVGVVALAIIVVGLNMYRKSTTSDQEKYNVDNHGQEVLT